MTSYLCKNEAETYKIVKSILLKFLTLEWDISRTIWRIEVSDGLFFAFFMLFHLSLFLDWRFPLRSRATVPYFINLTSLTKGEEENRTR